MSAFSAALTPAGFAVTRRIQGRSFAIVSARCAGGMVNEDYPRADSLIIYMGVGALGEVVKRLIDDGWPLDTPASLLERGTLPWEKHAVGALADIEAVAERERIASPALILVGKAALNLKESKGRPRILYTGLDPTRLSAYGEILHWPASIYVPDATGRIELPEKIEAVRRGKYGWVVFMRPPQVRAFVAALSRHQCDLRALGGVRIAAVDSRTARQLGQYGLIADAVIDPTEEEKTRWRLEETKPKSVLLAIEALLAQPPKAQLEAQGWQVDLLALLRREPHPELGRPLPPHDIIYFDHPTGVRAYREVYGDGAFRQEIWCRDEATLREIARSGRSGKVTAPAAT
jgi:uroporphyrinogen-III synthase